MSANIYTPQEKEIMKDGQDNDLSIHEIQGNLAANGYYRTPIGIAGAMKRFSRNEPEVFNPLKARQLHTEAMQDYSGHSKNERRGGKRNYTLNREAEIDKIFQCLNNENVPVMGYGIGGVSFSDGTLAIPIIRKDGMPIDDSYMSTARDYIKILFNGSIELQIVGLIARMKLPDSIDAVIEKEDDKLLVKPNEKKPSLVEYTKIFLEGYYKLLITNQIKTI